MAYLLAIGIGGSIGALSRYYLGRYIVSKCPTFFPWTTWIINCTGSFLLGLYIGVNNQGIIQANLDAMIKLGFLSSYTTFSTFIYEGMTLLQRKQTRYTCLYIVSSLLISIIAVYLGLAVS